MSDAERDCWRRIASGFRRVVDAFLELDMIEGRYGPPVVTDYGDVEDLNAVMDADAAANVAGCAHDWRGDGEAPRVCVRCGGLETHDDPPPAF
ncbi:MAG: hypothetical protein JO156_07045 [Solirubrobacterales bacterium]|nr:hypothetical protein [Solirubrobacterales bacterium]